MSRDFSKAYGDCGRVGIPPESMLKALLLRALAGHKSLRPIDENPAKQGEDDDDLNSWGGFKGKKRSNATHRSVVDPDALLKSKGGEAHPSHSMHVMTDSRSGMCLSVSVDRAGDRLAQACGWSCADAVDRARADPGRCVDGRACVEPA